MSDHHRRLWIFLALTADLSAAMLLIGSSRTAWPWELGPLLVALIVYSHHRPVRARPASTLILGGLMASGLALAIVTIVHLMQGGSAPTEVVLAFVVAPWPGHLLAAVSRLLPGQAVSVSGQGPRSRLARETIRRTPGCPWRLRPEGPGVTPVRTPTKPLDDRSALLRAGGADLPLHREGPAEGMGRAVKRTVDLVLAGCGLLLALPLMAFAAILTRLQGDGPAFYSQVRITEGGRHFRIHKIRSMIPDAEPDARPIWPEDHDPRITPLGRTLRRYWIDELPQLLDVLAGNLSLVGPRPERPYFAQEFARTLPKYALRHQVKGGVTGLAQVSGYVGNTSIARRLHMDLRYVRRWTPVLDLIILALTVVRMFQRPRIEAQTGHPLGSPRVGEEVESSLPKPPSTST